MSTSRRFRKRTAGLKALCISQAAGTPRNLHFYFRDDHAGLFKDFRKLGLLPSTEKWVLAFVYPNPGQVTWLGAERSMPQEFAHWHCVTSPEDFPSFFFLALWKHDLPGLSHAPEAYRP